MINNEFLQCRYLSNNQLFDPQIFLLPNITSPIVKEAIPITTIPVPIVFVVNLCCWAIKAPDKPTKAFATEIAINLVTFLDKIFLASMLLMIKCYREQWIGWVIVNIVSIIMWFVAYKSGSGDLTTMFMWIVYLINSLYGLFQWYRK